MKDRRIQTKRQAKKGFRTLFAKTAVRKQKASTASAADMDDIEGDIPKVGIGRALTVILVLHVVAIAAIYMGTKWKGAEPEASSAVAAYDENNKDTSSKTNTNNQHKFKVGVPTSYQQFPRDPQVSHQMPAAQNNTPAAQSQSQYRSQIGTATQPTVIMDPAPTRQPRVIRPKRNPNAHVNLPPAQEVRYKSHTIVSGDTIYRIALRNNVKDQEILDLNNIADARKIRIGMVIKVPVK